MRQLLLFTVFTRIFFKNAWRETLLYICRFWGGFISEKLILFSDELKIYTYNFQLLTDLTILKLNVVHFFFNNRFWKRVYLDELYRVKTRLGQISLFHHQSLSVTVHFQRQEITHFPLTNKKTFYQPDNGRSRYKNWWNGEVP